jgi:hypothetical protein
VTEINFSDVVFEGDGPDEQAVLYFLERMKANKGIPRLWVYQKPDGRYGVIDGRARLEALRRLGIQEFAAYVVTNGTPDQLRDFRERLNLRRQIDDPPDPSEPAP